MSDALPVPAAPPPLTMDQRREQSRAQLQARMNPGALTPAAAAALPPVTKPAAMPDTSLVGNAPSWLQSQKVNAWQGGPQVSMTNVDMGGLPEIPTNFADADRTGAEAAYKGATQFFDEDFGRDRAALENQLMNQGFARGTEAFDNAMGQMLRGQNAARENAGFMAQGVGHQQAGDLLLRALQARSSMLGERTGMADRLFDQSMGVAGLGLQSRGQDKGVEGTRISSSASAGASHYATDAAQARAALEGDLALRNLGLSQDAQDFNQGVTLAGLARGGVNMPNFGGATPLDVGNAFGIASGNANQQANRNAADNNALYQLGGTLLGSYLRSG